MRTAGTPEAEKYKTKKGSHGKTYDAIQELYGPMLASGLVQIETANEDNTIRIDGFLPKPDAGK